MLLEAPFCRSGVIKLPFRHSQAVQTICLGVMCDCCIEPLKSLHERSALLLGSQVLPPCHHPHSARAHPYEQVSLVRMSG